MEGFMNKLSDALRERRGSVVWWMVVDIVLLVISLYAASFLVTRIIWSVTP